MKYGSQKRHVFFNLDKQTEREMFQFSSSFNFSGWVKQQLAREMKRQQKQQISSAESTFHVRLDGENRV